MFRLAAYLFAIATASGCDEPTATHIDACFSACASVLVCQGTDDYETADATCQSDASQRREVGDCEDDWNECSEEEVAEIEACLSRYLQVCDRAEAQSCVASVPCAGSVFEGFYSLWASEQ